jgi:hypothetical protein
VADDKSPWTPSLTSWCNLWGGIRRRWLGVVLAGTKPPAADSTLDQHSSNHQLSVAPPLFRSCLEVARLQEAHTVRRSPPCCALVLAILEFVGRPRGATHTDFAFPPRRPDSASRHQQASRSGWSLCRRQRRGPTIPHAPFFSFFFFFFSLRAATAPEHGSNSAAILSPASSVRCGKCRRDIIVGGSSAPEQS